MEIIINKLQVLDETLQILWNSKMLAYSQNLISESYNSSLWIAERVKVMPISKASPPKYVIELADNLVYSIGKLDKLNRKGERKSALVQLRCETYSLFLLLKMECLFFFEQSNNISIVKETQQIQSSSWDKVIGWSKNEEQQESQYEVSIVVLFYNNKEITKECIESIYSYTKGIDFELITVNNGSDEETTDWVNSLPHTKKINLQYNIGSSRGGTLCLLPHILDGRYVAFVSNDTVLTTNWLENLLECIKSDASIGMVAPLCNAASNNQAIQVRYKNIFEMQQFASQFNKSDRKKWYQRARLLPVVGLFRPIVFQKIGTMNSLEFSYNMFADDDMCMRLKHAGFKMILCRDTFIHHYGSATIREEQYLVMEKGRKQFFDKYGFDSWYARNDNALQVAVHYLRARPSLNAGNLLIVNSLYGEEALFIKNHYNELHGINMEIDSFTTDITFKQDLECITSRSNYSPSMGELVKFAGERKYDIIFLASNIADCSEFKSFFSIASNLLSTEGKILCFVENFHSYRTIASMRGMKAGNSDPLARKCYVSLDAIQEYVNSHGLSVVQCVAFSSMPADEWEHHLNGLVKIETENERCNFSIDFFGLIISKSM